MHEVNSMSSFICVEFCQKITEKEALRAAGKMDDDDDTASVAAPDDDDGFIHHPFAVREPTNMEITMRIRVSRHRVTSKTCAWRMYICVLT